MNEQIIHSEAELKDALRNVLDRRILRIVGKEDRTAHGRADFTIEAGEEGHAAIFAAACKLNPTVTALEQAEANATGKRHPLLVTVRLPESFVQECRHRGVSCLDLNGRVWIKAPGLLIDRNVPSSTVRYRLAETEIRFFAPKSARLARALLHTPDRIWRQSDLAAITGLSQGLLSRLLNHAVRQGWVEGRRGDWKLTQADGLLDAWEQEDRFSKRVTIRQYSTLEPDVHAIARQLVERTQGELAFTQWFAAGLRYPYADVPIVSAYRREFPTEGEQRALNYREVDDGGKIRVLVPGDAGVFQTIQRIEEFPLVSDAQIYLDLVRAGLRGPDQAQALRKWKGFCRP